MSRDDYVETYVQILRAADEAHDSIEAWERARQILDRRKLSQDDLLDFARFYADDPQYMSEVWQEIETRLKEPVATDTARGAAKPPRRRPNDPSKDPSGDR